MDASIFFDSAHFPVESIADVELFDATVAPFDAFCLNATIDISEFNFSEYDYPGEGGGPRPPPLGVVSALKITFCVINMIVSIMGNCAVIIAVYHNPALRSTINFYLVNLAVADVLIALCCMWPHLVNDLTKPAFVLGAFMCKFNAFAQMTCLTSSVLTLTAISCDRFMAVMYPLRVRITQCRARAVIISIWIISITVAVPFAVYRQLFEIKWRNGVEVSCQETWPRMSYYDPIKATCSTSVWPKTAYYSLVSVTLFFLPIIIMSIAYALIIGRLWGSKPPGEKLDAALTNQSRAKRKELLMSGMAAGMSGMLALAYLYPVVKMVCIILLVFIVCWAPLQVLILFAQFSHNSRESGELPEWYDQVMFLVYSIAYTNSTLNPLLYGGLNQTYRKTLIRVLFRKCCQWRAGRDSGISMQGSLQLAEFRASPQVGLVAHNLSSSTHSTRFGHRGRLINHHHDGALTAGSGYVTGIPRGHLSVQLSSTVATSSLKCQSSLKCHVQVVPPQPPANVSSTVLPLDSGINTDGSEFRLAITRPLRSGSSQRRKHELLG